MIPDSFEQLWRLLQHNLRVGMSQLGRSPGVPGRHFHRCNLTIHNQRQSGERANPTNIKD